MRQPLESSLETEFATRVEMKRLLNLLPWIGLGLIMLAMLVRGLREEGLGLRAFPAPPDVLLGTHDSTAPAAHLSGVLLNDEGEVVSEALVLAAFNGELAWTYTDVQGRFDLQHLPAGPVELEVVARKYRTERFQTKAPGADLEFVMNEPVDEVQRVPALERSDLEGHVVSSVGRRGLLDYEVLLLPARAPHEFGEPVPVRAAVGADRGFRFEGLIHGEYRVVILPPWAKGGSWPNLCDSAQRTYTHGPSAGELELPMAAGELHGRVLDTTGRPVEGALVLLAPEAAPNRPWQPAASDATGAFEVRDLPPGSYQLDLRAGEASWRESVKVLAGHTSVLDLPPLAVRSQQR